MSISILNPEHLSRLAVLRAVLARISGLSISISHDLPALQVFAGNKLKTEAFEKMVHSEIKRLALKDIQAPGHAWPAPIAHTIRDLVNESLGNGIRNAYRMVDLFEVLIKYITTIVISDMVRGPDFPQTLKELLAESLNMPYLGKWAGYCRACAHELSNRNQKPFVPEILDYQDKYLKADLDILLALRNIYAHGATPPEDQCVRHCIENMPILIRLLQGAAFLKEYPLICVKDSSMFLAMGEELLPLTSDHPGSRGSAFLQNPSSDSLLELSPLLTYGKCLYKGHDGFICGRYKFLFYNDHRKKTFITYLDYRNNHHGRDTLAPEYFREIFPIPEWRSAREKDRIASIIDEKAEGFIGREDEIKDISRWVSSARKGFFMVLGPPGIGKSALAASLARHEWVGIDVLCHFIRRIDRPTPIEFLRRLLNDLSRTFGSRFVAGSLEEMQIELDNQLKLAKNSLQEPGRKLLIIIDGLDEALARPENRTGGKNILDLLPRHVPDNVLILMTARPRTEIMDLYHELDREAKQKVTLEGLSIDEVRGLLYGPISKYELKPEYAGAVLEKSQGNPLYVKLLSEEIFQGRLMANDVLLLPGSLSEVYESILKRLMKESNDVLKVLLTLAYAREQLTISQISAINQFNLQRTILAVDVCLEILSEDIDVSGNRTVSVYHDSFADFLKNHKDLAGEREKIFISYLRYTISHENKSAVTEKIILALIRNQAISMEDLPVLASLLEAAGSLLTSFSIAVKALSSHSIARSSVHMAGLARIPGPATARAVTECLSACLRNNPGDARTFLQDLFPDRNKSGKSWPDPGASQTARVCADLCVELLDCDQARNVAVDFLNKLVQHSDQRVKSLGVLGVFRASRLNPKASLDVVQKLGNQAIMFGLPRPSMIEPLVGCMLGLLFEHAEDQEFRAELREIASNTLSRTILIRPLAWLLPRYVSTFLSKVPDDYNPLNLAELRTFKKELASDPELVDNAAQMIAHCDPGYGTRETFREAMWATIPLLKKHKSTLLMYILLQLPVLNRTLAGDMSALEDSYQHWKLMKDQIDVSCQEFAYQLRMVQIGLRIQGRPPLEEKWSHRAEEVVRNFFYVKGAVFTNTRKYQGGSIISALPFIVAQNGDFKPSILKEMIDHALKNDVHPAEFNYDQNPPLYQIILRVLEVNAVEYGTYDPAGRVVAFYGLRCFFEYHNILNEAAWLLIIKILAKMQLFYPDEVESFLIELPDRIEQNIRRRLQNTIPQNKPGELLSLRSEKFLATLYSEPYDANYPLRRHMQNVLYSLARPENLKASLRQLIREVFTVIRK